jgi:hypothetical protein
VSMNKLRMKALRRDAENLAVESKHLTRLSRDDKQLESLFASAQECFLLARERANENLERGEIREGETVEIRD